MSFGFDTAFPGEAQCRHFVNVFFVRIKFIRHHRLVDNMVMYHFIGHRGQQPQFVKGGVKPVLITQEIRTGRKTVTKVSGLEYFFIDVDTFGQEMQVICAGSVASKFPLNVCTWRSMKTFAGDLEHRTDFVPSAVFTSYTTRRSVAETEPAGGYGAGPSVEERDRGAAGKGCAQEVHRVPGQDFKEEVKIRILYAHANVHDKKRKNEKIIASVLQVQTIPVFTVLAPIYSISCC